MAVSEQLNVHYLDEPFKIEEMPLGNTIYVLDNYLESSLHKAVDIYMRNCSWQKSNQVNTQIKNRGGLPNHSLWGCNFFHGHDMRDGYLHGSNGYPNHLMRWLDRRLRTDFGFEWVRFQYAGGNSQTHGQHGTCHSDCSPNDNWNLSFLYYTNQFWNPNWGGRLRFYSDNIEGGILEEMNALEIGSVDFVPNRLLMFDGRIQHGAEAPCETARYIDRKSIVIRGDEIELVSESERYANH
tara:strand:+ start:32134 stop:32850 length:717 start_codon:yes stop_codon:yes gene_type:complete